MVDGWPTAMLAGCRVKQRVAWLDALPDLCALAERKGWLIFHVGNEPGVFPRARQNLRMAGQHGHFDQTPGSAESRTTVELINWHQPHIVTIGMGMPTEALWLDAHRQLIHAPVVIQVGATMDYFAGDLPTAPRWLGPLGLEWAFRLATSPRRTWRRNLVEPWQILAHAMKGGAL